MLTRIKNLLKAIAPLLVVAAVGGFALSLLKGDGCGPVERGIRAGLGTWDMWETAMISPYQMPLASVPADTVPLGGRRDTYEQARTVVDAMPAEERTRRASVVYRRFCHHCHGPNGDNRIIVGESFGFALPDLRQDKVQGLTDDQIFESLTRGTEKMIPLAATLSAVDRVLALTHLRSLKGRPSEPFFKPRWVEPAEQPGGPKR